jgi:hypothetical protein
MLVIDDEDICGETMRAIRAANHKRHLEAPELAIGDRVKVIRPDGNWLEPEAIYEVVGAIKSSVCGNLVELDRPRSILWGAWRFAKVAQ